MLKRASEKRIFDFDKKAVAFWMEVEGEVSIRFVLVFVTHEALSDIDPNQVRDVDGVLTTFDLDRDRIDRAANTKLDEGKTADWLHEGQPVTVRPSQGRGIGSSKARDQEMKRGYVNETKIGCQRALLERMSPRPECRAG